MSSSLRSAAFGGKRNAQQVLADTMGVADEIESLVLAVRFKDGSTSAAWTDGEKLVHLGTLECAKDELLAKLREGVL